MKLNEIKKIGDEISKKYGVYYNYFEDSKDKEGVIAERVKTEGGLRCIEVRTELVSYEGGDEFMYKVAEKMGYEGENLGGCVYRFYKGDEIK